MFQSLPIPSCHYKTVSLVAYCRYTVVLDRSRTQQIPLSGTFPLLSERFSKSHLRFPSFREWSTLVDVPSSLPKSSPRRYRHPSLRAQCSHRSPSFREWSTLVDVPSIYRAECSTQVFPQFSISRLSVQPSPLSIATSTLLLYSTSTLLPYSTSTSLLDFATSSRLRPYSTSSSLSFVYPLSTPPPYFDGAIATPLPTSLTPSILPPTLSTTPPTPSLLRPYPSPTLLYPSLPHNQQLGTLQLSLSPLDPRFLR